MKRYVPQFKDYSGAIAANNSMSNAFNQLSNQSQDHLNYVEQQKQNAFDNQYKTDTLNETKRQNAFSNQFRNKEFDYGVGRDKVKDNQWQQTFDETKSNNAFDRSYKTNVFNHNVSQDKIRNNQWQQSFNLQRSNSNKPKYVQVTTTDESGKPVLSFVDPNTGKTINTGMNVYQAPKQLSPEQIDYYNARNQEILDKRNATMEKDFRETPEFIGLGEADQLKAIEYLRANGKVPTISYDGGWTGKGYYLPMSETDKKAKDAQLKKDMEVLGL